MIKGILTLFVLATMVTGSFSNNYIMAQSVNSETRMVTVSGEGVVNIVPDMATVRFGIVVNDKDPEEARRINAETAREAMNSIRELGIPESKLSLQTLRLQPLREYDPGNQASGR